MFQKITISILYKKQFKKLINTVVNLQVIQISYTFQPIHPGKNPWTILWDIVGLYDMCYGGRPFPCIRGNRVTSKAIRVIGKG